MKVTVSAYDANLSAQHSSEHIAKLTLADALSKLYTAGVTQPLLIYGMLYRICECARMHVFVYINYAVQCNERMGIHR